MPDNLPLLNWIEDLDPRVLDTVLFLVFGTALMWVAVAAFYVLYLDNRDMRWTSLTFLPFVGLLLVLAATAIFGLLLLGSAVTVWLY